MYRDYKQNVMQKQISQVVEQNRDMQTLEFRLQKMKRESNAIILYEIEGKTYNCYFQEYCTPINERIIDDFQQDHNNYITIDEKLDVDNREVLMHFIMPLSSTQEVQNILVLFLPLFGLLSISMSLILSYFISSRLSGGILKLNSDAQKITNLDFDVGQSIENDDELGDLSLSLKKLANELEKNIDELNSTNAKLTSDIERERKMEEERRAYIATLSHDLKTPLTAIKGQLEGMLYNVGKYKDRDTYLKKNIELTNDMQEIIQSIIVSSKLDDYNTTLKLDDFNLSKYIEDIIPDFEYKIEDKKLVVENNLEKNIIIKADASLFPKALTNLISNAIEYSDTESTITIDGNVESLMITNKASDFDVNMLKDDLIFKPFSRQDKSRNTTGSGLGMYISKRIIELHNFVISVEYVDQTVIIKIDFTSN